MEIAQEEVLTCLGLCVFERLHRIQQRFREEERTWEIIMCTAIQALRRSFEVAVENKLGVSQLELLCQELNKEELAKQQRKERKKLNRKRKKEKKTEENVDTLVLFYYFMNYIICCNYDVVWTIKNNDFHLFCFLRLRTLLTKLMKLWKKQPR